MFPEGKVASDANVQRERLPQLLTTGQGIFAKLLYVHRNRPAVSESKYRLFWEESEMDLKEWNQELSWDSSIEEDGTGLLQPGEYNASVKWFERARHNGSEKIPPCDKAVVTLVLDVNGMPCEMAVHLLLHKKLEWRLSEFFRAIGQKKPGQRVTMDWSRVIGSRLRVQVRNRTYKDRDGQEHTVNDIDRFLDYDPQYFTDEPAWLQEAMKAEETEPFDEVF